MNEPPVILLAEDRDDDILLIRGAFLSAGFATRLLTVSNGEEAILYLAGEGKFANRTEYPFPQLLLLDLKMPRVDGFEVLRWVHARPELGRLPVIVLTSSDDLRDVTQAYQLGAKSFLVKPLDFLQFTETCKTIRDYWL